MALRKFESRDARRRRPFDLTHGYHRDVSAPPVLPLHPELVAGLIIAAVLLLASAHVFTTLLPLLHGQTPPEWAHQFDLGRENNVPTWVASTTLLFCAGLLGIVGTTKYRERDRFRWHWLVLAAGFVVLSMDEAASLHELLGRTMESRIQLTGYFYYGSTLPLLACMGFVAAAYTQFLLHLPLHTRITCLLAGLLYVGGALGCEMLESREEFATQSQATAAYHSWCSWRKSWNCRVSRCFSGR